jgi:hypothetical protein
MITITERNNNSTICKISITLLQNKLNTDKKITI